MEIILIIVGIVLVLGIFYFNKIVKHHNRVQETSAGIDVALSKRYQLIPNLVEVVKGYSKHEKATLELIVKKRNEGLSRVEYDTQVQSVLTQLIALTENYPDLKADTQFSKLQYALVDVEENLQAARRLFNHEVQLYNTNIGSFPGVVIAKVMKYTPSPYFEAEEKDRNLPNVSLLLEKEGNDDV